jgi:hypothetical protein
MAMLKAPKSRSGRSKKSRARPKGPAKKQGRKSRTSRSSAREPKSRARAARGRYTLEQELGTLDFAKRGWHRLSDLADYISFLVDGRSVGFFDMGDPKVFNRLLALANTLKAAAQWFAFDHKVHRPPFALEAERYLVQSAHGKSFLVPFMPQECQCVNLRTGPVLPRKGGRGAGGRLHSLAALVAQMVDFMERSPRRS